MRQFLLFFLPPSTGVGEKHRGGRRRGSFQRQRQKDPQAPDHLLQSPAAGSEQAVPANPVSGSAGESRARRITGAHANTGMCSAFTRFQGSNRGYIHVAFTVKTNMFICVLVLKCRLVQISLYKGLLSWVSIIGHTSQ